MRPFKFDKSETTMDTKILYHANCNDGSGAALAAWLYFGDKRADGTMVEYIPVQYGSDPPAITECDVYILDFSYPRDVICHMATEARKIVIIDHHKTAEADLSAPFPSRYDEVPLCDIETIFDKSRSGAVLAWKYFHSDEPVPPLLAHIEDRDLWKFELPMTEGITKALQIYPDWKDWLQFILNPDTLNDLNYGGQCIDKYLKVQSEKITTAPPKFWHIESTEVPVYNLPGFMLSDTLHMALQKYPESPYAVGYFDLPDGKRVYSLRSRSGSDVDVSDIAKRHGGGGHKHAAGFTI